MRYNKRELSSQHIVYAMNDYPAKFVAAGTKTVGADCTCQLHWHDCCEVELVLSGSGTHIINGIPHTLGEGDLYMFTPADSHKISAKTKITVIGIMFGEKRISDEIFGHILSLEASGRTLLVNLKPEIRAAVRSFFEGILREETNLRGGESAEIPLFSELYIGRLLDCILIGLLRGMKDGGEKITRNELVRSALIYIYSHYTERITLDGISAILHINSSYFSRLFKKVTGQTFKSFLIGLRIGNACRLLTNTELSITEICYSCGFESYPHFMRTFSEYSGVSPLSFRRLNTAKPQ